MHIGGDEQQVVRSERHLYVRVHESNVVKVCRICNFVPCSLESPPRFHVPRIRVPPIEHQFERHVFVPRRFEPISGPATTYGVDRSHASRPYATNLTDILRLHIFVRADVNLSSLAASQGEIGPRTSALDASVRGQPGSASVCRLRCRFTRSGGLFQSRALTTGNVKYGTSITAAVRPSSDRDSPRTGTADTSHPLDNRFLPREGSQESARRQQRSSRRDGR